MQGQPTRTELVVQFREVRHLLGEGPYNASAVVAAYRDVAPRRQDIAGLLVLCERDGLLGSLLKACAAGRDAQPEARSLAQSLVDAHEAKPELARVLASALLSSFSDRTYEPETRRASAGAAVPAAEPVAAPEPVPVAEPAPAAEPASASAPAPEPSKPPEPSTVRGSKPKRNRWIAFALLAAIAVVVGNYQIYYGLHDVYIEVVDSVTEDGVADARVTITSQATGESVQTKTGKQGGINASLRRGSYDIEISADDYEGSYDQVLRVPADGATYSLERETHAFSGRITDAKTGDPISGASVTLNLAGDYGEERVTSGEDGRYETSVQGEVRSVDVSASGHKEQKDVAPAEGEYVCDVELEPLTYTVSGTVYEGDGSTDNGARVAGAQIFLFQNGKFIAEETSSDDGSFALTIPSRGSYRVFVGKAGMLLYCNNVAVTQDQDPDVHQDYYLGEQGDANTGIVIFISDAKTGKPIPEASVSSRSYSEPFSREADQDGFYVCEVQWSGPTTTVSYTISASGYKDKTVSFRHTKGSINHVEVALEPEG